MGRCPNGPFRSPWADIDGIVAWRSPVHAWESACCGGRGFVPRPPFVYRPPPVPPLDPKPPVRLSIVLPAHNEQEVLPQTHARLTACADAWAVDGVEATFLFVDDGSRDGTAALLDDLAARDPRTIAVHLTRNFGHQAAITAGLELATGHVVAVMDADLQDPPEVLPRFLERWREGNQVVYAVRQKRKEGPLKRAAYWAFYRLLAATSDVSIPLDAGDFCLMDRHAVDLLNRLPERQRFVRGLRTWVGLKQVGVPYERDARAAGEPQYTFGKLLALAADGLISFSGAPLRLVTRLGLCCAALSVLFLLWVLVDGLFRITSFNRGWPSLAALVTLLGSVQLVSLGIIGEYLSRIFLEVKGRPTYLIARVEGREQASVEAAVKPSPARADVDAEGADPSAPT